MTRFLAAAIAASFVALGPLGAHAASAADYEAAMAAATAAEDRAGQARNQWTSTEDALKAARSAADAKEYDRATELAKLANAMADQSLAQAREQADAWREAVIR